MYDLGDVIPLEIRVTNAAGALANVGTMTLAITQPDGTAATITNPVAPASTGVYDYDFTPAQAGLHRVRWVATGANAGAYEDVFNVESSTQALVSLAETKEFLNIPATTTTNDGELRGRISAASCWVEGRIGPVWRRTVVETVTPSDGVLCLSRPPVISLTSVVGAYGYGSAFTVGSLYLDTEAGIVHSGLTSLSFGCYPLTVTYVAGRTSVPTPVREATLEIVRALWGSQRGPGDLESMLQGDTSTADSEFGNSLGLAKWKAEQLLAPYMTPVVA